MINEKIINILPLMTADLDKNIKIIYEKFSNLYYLDEDNQTLLHIFLSNKFDERETILAIKSLLKCGRLDPNLKDDCGYNFIQTALHNGYSEKFILELISVTLASSNRLLNVNTIDCNGNTIVHTAINSEKYHDNIVSIYSVLCNNGFDSTKKNNYNESLLDALNDNKDKFDKQEIIKFKQLFNDKTNFLIENKEHDKDVPIDEKNFLINISKDDITKIEKIGKILNYKNYNTYPVVGRENEIESLIISLASFSTSPLIIGEHGVGKSILVDELVYRIENEQVPHFLRNKLVIEVNPSELIAGAKYSGTFEERIKTLMEICSKYDAILFIDKIHRTYGTGTHDSSKVDMASMLVPYMEKEGIKIIGTTSLEEYNEYFQNSDLKYKFDVIKVSEPDYNTLYKIIEKVILDYSLKTNINSYYILKNTSIIDLLIEVTNKKHRVYNDNINNPKLVISIIDKAFAYARVDNSNELKTEHFIKSLNLCNRIYPTAKEKVIEKLSYSNKDYNEIKNNSKVLKIDFATRR